MRKSYDAMRASIIEATSLIEALIDFGEDEGISEGVFEQGQHVSLDFGLVYLADSLVARNKVMALRDQINRRLADGRRGEIIRSGIHLAIIGAPNAGKSSLLNWLGELRPHSLCSAADSSPFQLNEKLPSSLRRQGQLAMW